MGIVQKDATRLTVVSYAGVLIGYINKILLFPNFLQTDQVGLANTLISIAALYAQFSALGMPVITLRFFPFFSDKERKHHGFMGFGMLLLSAGFILTTLVFIFFKPIVVRVFGENSPLLVEYYYYLIPLGLATVLFQFFDAYLRSLLKTVVASFVNEVYLRLLITLSISAYALGWLDFVSFVNLYVGFNCSIALVLVVYAIYLKQFHLTSPFTFRLKRLYKYIVKYGMFSILASTGNVLIASIDILMIAALLKNGMDFAGIYSTVFFMSTVILIPYRSILKITGPLISEYWKKKDMARMGDLYKKVTLVNLVIGSFIFLGLWANIDNFFYFMPEEYASGRYVFLFVSLGRLFDMVTGLNGVITITSRKYAYDLFFTAFLIAFTIVSNYIFIRYLGMGMQGAALATMLTFIIYNCMRLYFVFYNFRIQPFTKGCVYVLLIGVFTFFAVTYLPFTGNVFLDMAVKSLAVGLLFALPVVYFRISVDINDFASKTPFFGKLTRFLPK